MNLSFRNRIGLYYMAATAIIMAVAFLTVYFVVRGVVYQNLDRDLSYEAKKHTREIKVIGDSIKIKNKREWEEREHREVQVNPVFIQFWDKNGVFMDKSPNLKENHLKLNANSNYNGHYNGHLNQRPIRQVQLPIEDKGKLKGFIVAAMSLEASQMVLYNLRNILLIVYLLLLASLYFISKFIAGRSIIPVKNVIQTTNRITRNSLNERVELPQNKDEMFDLTSSINDLLNRIENALERERQFTSDASHELRTPLATLKGTLEVLVRKPRERSEYEEKIKLCLTEINRITSIIEQLLLLARLDTGSKSAEKPLIPLTSIIEEILFRHNNVATEKKLTIKIKNDIGDKVLIPQYFGNLILENIIENALKYAKDETTIHIALTKSESKVICKIRDEGIGIKEGDLHRLFNNFFRSDPLQHKDVTGNGLGLSIAKKAADAINTKISVESEFGKGTIFTVEF
ncbi:ATP-binding protein [uncultured Mesonia sp.]|jgi:signal transduction histidine kinase|uniref:HAMP domain-containing sensor histidine kinase n=1 Tax=uncultured Mesonia sp. TaxID=399731 RepID=UPI00374F7C37